MAGSSPADVEKNTRIQPNEINDDAGVIDQTDAASNLKGTQEVLDPFGYDDGEIQCGWSNDGGARLTHNT